MVHDERLAFEVYLYGTISLFERKEPKELSKKKVKIRIRPTNRKKSRKRPTGRRKERFGPERDQGSEIPYPEVR